MDSKKEKQTESKIRPINTKSEVMVAGGKGGGRMGKMHESEWEIQDSNYGKNKS